MKLDDIARIAGVSKASVSFAINNKPGVGKATRERILKIASDLGYSRGKQAQMVHSNRLIQFLAINTAAFPVKSNISNTFFAELIRNLEKTCSDQNCLLFLSTLNMDELPYGMQLIRQNNQCLGTVLLGTNLSDAELAQVGTDLNNLVVIDNAAEGMALNTIAINNYQGASSAAEYLLRRGASSFGYVMSGSRLRNFEERYRGFCGRLEKSGIPPGEVEVFSVGQQIGEAQAAFKQMLDTREKPLPGALFCESDYIAIGVIRAMQRKGIRIPRDVSVIGFDDVPEASVLNPELTTVHVSKDAIGEIAGKRILEIIRDGSKPSLKFRIDTDLKVRSSTL